MSPQLRALIYLEWQQRRWQLLLCLVVTLGGSILMFLAEPTNGSAFPLTMYMWSVGIVAVFLPLFVATRTSLGEMSDHTLSFSQALPVSPTVRSVIRLAGGAFVLWTSILLAAGLFTLVIGAGWRASALSLSSGQVVGSMDIVARIWQQAYFYCVAASTIYLIVCMIGNRLRNELMTTSLGVVVVCLTLLMLDPYPFGYRFSRLDGNRYISVVRHILSPLSWLLNPRYSHYYPDSGQLPLSAALIPNALLQLFLAIVFVRTSGYRYATAETQPRKFREATVLWRGQFSLCTPDRAIIWLTMRQTLPLCLAGAALAWLLSAAVLNSEFIEWSVYQHPKEFWLRLVLEQFAQHLRNTIFSVGFLWSVVVGSMVFAPESDRRLGEFWRAVPIQPGRLFAIKYVVGLLAVLVVLDASMIATYAAFMPDRPWNRYQHSALHLAAETVPLHAMVFTFAVLLTCWLRRPVLAAMLTIASCSYLYVVLNGYELTRLFVPGTYYSGSWAIALGLTLTSAFGAVAAYRLLMRYRTGRLFS